MFTTVEGEWDDVMDLVKACVLEVAGFAPRVGVVLKIDYRPGSVDQLEHKTAAIEALLEEREA